MPHLADVFASLERSETFASENLHDASARWEFVCENARGDEILDIGCGDGALTDLIRRAASPRRMVGSDGRDTALREARRAIPDIEFRRHLAEKIPFPEKSFDVMHAGEIAHLVRRPDLFIKRISSLARKRAVLSIPHAAGESDSTTLPRDRFIADCEAAFARVEANDIGSSVVATCDDPLPLSCAWVPVAYASTRSHVLFHPGRGRIHAIHANTGRFYEPDLLDFIASRGLSGVYVDIGAHIGNHTVFFAEECP